MNNPFRAEKVYHYSSKEALLKFYSIFLKSRCKPGWSGEMCDKQLQQHKLEAIIGCNLECKNGGKCQVNSNGMAACKCDTSLFKGDLCQIKVILETCSNDFCLNGGSCLANGECLCPPGYAGERCQTKRLTSQCGLVTCYNGGTCFIDNQNEYACMCHHVFTGRFCESKLETTPKPIASKTNTPATTTPTTTTTTATAALVKTLVLTNESAKHVEKSRFTLQEIFLILLAGIGMPIFSILIVVLLYRINVNRKLNENLKQVQTDTGRLSKIAVENIYVECNNIKNNNKHDTTSKIEIKNANTTIQMPDDLSNKLKDNKVLYSNENSMSDNNIYSIIDFSNENHSAMCAIGTGNAYANFNKKNSNLHEYQVSFV